LLEPTTLPSEAFKLACSFFVGLVKACPDRALFAPLVKALPRATSAFAREALVRSLPLVNNLAEHGLLVGALRHNDEAVRTAALRVIEKVAVATTIEAIAGDMRSGVWHPGASAALGGLLEKLGARALPLFQAAIGNGDGRMVVAGFDALAHAAPSI